MDAAALRIQSIYRRHTILAKARVLAKTQIDHDFACSPNISWNDLSNLVRKINFIADCKAVRILPTEDVQRLAVVLRLLLKSLEIGGSSESYVSTGIENHFLQISLQFRKICAIVIQYLSYTR